MELLSMSDLVIKWSVLLLMLSTRQSLQQTSSQDDLTMAIQKVKQLIQSKFTLLDTELAKMNEKLDYLVQAMSSNTSTKAANSMAEATTTISPTTILNQKFFDAASNGNETYIKDEISRLSESCVDPGGWTSPLPDSCFDLNWRNPDHNNYTALHIATEKNHHSIVAALLDAEVNQNVKEIDGMTPMYMAARDNRVSLLRLLLDQKYQAAVNTPDKNGWSPVYIATFKGHTAALELLLANGGDPNQVALRNHDPTRQSNAGYSPLMSACWWGRVEDAKLLIEAGANVNYVRPQDRTTPLHWGSKYDQVELTRLLLQNGADKTKEDVYGHTPVYWAGSRTELGKLIKNY